MSMTRKHFRAIANALNSQIRIAEHALSGDELRTYRLAMSDAAATIAAEMYDFNPGFQKQKFMDAVFEGTQLQEQWDRAS